MGYIIDMHPVNSFIAAAQKRLRPGRFLEHKVHCGFCYPCGNSLVESGNDPMHFKVESAGHI